VIGDMSVMEFWEDLPDSLMQNIKKVFLPYRISEASW
jgi:hypothetical protein